MTKFKIIQKKVRKHKAKTVYDDFVELGLPSKPNPYYKRNVELERKQQLTAIRDEAVSSPTNFRYTYSIRKDFAGNVDTARLHTEIQHSLSAPLVAIETEADHLHIIFGRILSPTKKQPWTGISLPQAIQLKTTAFQPEGCSKPIVLGTCLLQESPGEV